MSTAIIKGLAYARETTFALVDSTTGVPAPTSVTYIPFAFERASFVDVGGASELVEDGTALADAFGLPPEVATSWSGGARVRRQTGSLSLTMRVTGWGAGSSDVTDPEDLALVALLGSGLKLNIPATTGPGAVTGMGANNGITNFGSPPDLTVGEVVLAVFNGCVMSNRCTGIAGNTATWLHYWPGDMTGIALRRGLNLVASRGADTGAVEESIALRGTVLQGEVYMLGSRMESVTFTPDGGQLLAELTMRAAFITPDIVPAGVTPVQAVRVAAPTVTLRGSALRRTDSATGYIAGGTAPLSVASSSVPYELEGWSLALSNTLVPVGVGCTAVGESDVEVAGTAVTFSYTSKVITDADEDDLLNRVSRGLALAAGPVDDGATTTNGWGCSIPAAHLTADHNIQAPDGDILQQARQYAAGAYGGDTTGTANVVFFIGGAT